MLLRTCLPLLLAFSLLSSPVTAEQVTRALRAAGGEQGAGSGPGVATAGSSTKREGAPPASTGSKAARPYQENLIVEVGAMESGTPEEKYAIALQKEVGGRRLHGDFTLDDLVEAIVPPHRKTNPIDNIIFCGHIVLIPSKNMPEAKPVKPGEEYLGFLLVGKQSKDRCLNFNDQFLEKLDQKMCERGLTPDQIFGKKSRIAIRVCLTAKYMPDFLEAWAKRLPETCTIEAYTVPFVWSTATWYPLASNLFGPFNTKYLFGEQAQGLTTYPGTWKPVPPKPPAPARRERVPDFAGMESR